MVGVVIVGYMDERPDLFFFNLGGVHVACVKRVFLLRGEILLLVIWEFYELSHIHDVAFEEKTHFLRRLVILRV